MRRIDPRRAAALEMLGVGDDAEPEDVKRAYRKLARALHPDLQPHVDGDRRRALERRFAEVTAAYESLAGL
jgi:molecular chaperone DnaJ